jgi:hypothetical protein
MPDNLALEMGAGAKPQPALSATSDMPDPTAAPAAATETTTTSATPSSDNVVDKTATPGVESTTAASEHADNDLDDSASSDDVDSGADTAARPQRSKGGFQKRIDELTKANAESRRQLTEALEALNKRQTEPVREAPAEDARPVRDHFDNPDDFTAAVADWSAKKAVREYQSQAQAEQQREAGTREFQTILNRWDEGRAKAIEAHPDYVEVAENPAIPVAQHVGIAVLNTPNGHDVLYYLGQNPKEAARISGLMAPQAALEIGMLSAKLEGNGVQTSKAPAPVRPVSSSRNSAEKVAPEDDPNYMENRLAELRKGNRNR